jgi:nucleotide-binding universal stress UspA family protein
MGASEAPGLAEASGALTENAPVYRRALVPLDGSAVAETVIPSVLRIAAALDLEVVLVQVVAAFPPGTPEGSARQIDESRRRLDQEARAYLQSVAERLAGHVRTRIVVRRGEAAAEIVEAAAEERVDLIAMTTHGRRGLSRLLFGSVAEAVLRQARIPIFLRPIRETEAARLAA